MPVRFAFTALLLTGVVFHGICQTIPTTMGYQMSDAVLYESFFNHVLFLDGIVTREASPKGWDGLPPRDRIQRVCGFTDLEMATLLAVARDRQFNFTAISQVARQAIQTARAQASSSGAPSAATKQQITDLQSKREQIALDGVGQLRTTLGPVRFRRLDSYVRRTSAVKAVSTPQPAPAKP